MSIRHIIYMMKKVLSLFLIILLLSSIFLIFLEMPTANASYSNKFSNYPGYKELLETLQKEHPNWEFEIVEVKQDWSEILKAESVAHHGRSLISKYDKAFDKCSICGNKQYEPGWYCASRAAVSYYLDPRNSICEDYIFQFEQLTYDSATQTKKGVEKILADCDYMQGTINYIDTKGKKQTINKTYIDVIMEAAKEYNVSPYHIASRIRQEIGTGKGSVIISGTVSGYTGYYNYFNWGAFGSNIIGSGLQTAKDYGWTNPEKAIKGGVQRLSKEYISQGQDTLYFQKFNVLKGCTHQYMTNVSASKSEGSTVRKAYKEIGMLSKDSKIKFKIPVYKNMPTFNSPLPGKETIVTQDVQFIRETNIREKAGTSAKIIKTVAQNTKVIRIEIGNKKIDGYYWDKIVLSDGTKGYAINSNLKGITLQSNCNVKYIVLNTINIYNGPGTTGTEVMRNVSAGQIITVVEKEKYPNLEKENWYRIRTTDGDYGYVAIGTSENPNITIYDENSTVYDYVKVICTDGLNIRNKPTTSGSNIITTVTQGTELFRVQKNVSNDGGYIWDKVVTSSGIVGYTVRQDKQTGEAWIVPINTNYSVNETKKNITCIPNLTVNNLKSLSSKVVVKKGTQTIKENEKIGTGYTITANGKTYTAVVKGDPSCDAQINSADLLKVVKHLKGTNKFTDDNVKSSADVNSDENINSADLLKIVKYLKGTGNIEV